MSIRYPKNPRFNKLQMRSPDCRTWQEGCAHDPSLLEWQGNYYAYSTDTFGAPCGYQIRKSSDLLHWEYAGSAFPLEGSAPAYKKGEGKNAYGKLQPAYDWCVTAQSEVGYGVCTRKDGAMSLWAPHCVRGSDGKFWLYFCLTGYFGGSKSCIGLAKSSSPEGGFEFEGLVVQSPAGWRTPNAIDPQFFIGENGRAFLIYGSYGLGLYLIELDPQTGLRKDGREYADFSGGGCSFEEYYGVRLASGSLEGGVIRYHEGVDVLEKGKWVKKNYYYLMCSYGSLSSVYNMRCGRSEKPEGPYVDVNGNQLFCSTDIGTGNKMLGSFRWEEGADFFCPGHNDMYVTEKGVNLISYHCRTNYFIEKGLSRSNNFHYLYLSQYTFNSAGWPVMNANRYAGEELQEVTAEVLLNITAGKFETVLFTQGTDTVRSVRITLRSDGSIVGGFAGCWRMYGSRYICVTIGGEEYYGVVMPAWIEGQGVAGLTVSAMGSRSGMALHMNSTAKI